MTRRHEIRGIPRPWGETTCGYGKYVPECTASATRHFMWLDTGAIAGACDEHAVFVRERSIVPVEEHAFAADCGMPGALWHHPYEDEPEGYCVFPAPDDVSALVEEPAQLELAGVAS